MNYRWFGQVPTRSAVIVVLSVLLSGTLSVAAKIPGEPELTPLGMAGRRSTAVRDRFLAEAAEFPHGGVGKASVQEVHVGDPVIEAQLGHTPSGVQADPDDPRPEDPAAQRLPRERVHEGESCLAEERARDLTDGPPVKPQAGLDHPDPVFVEGGLGGNSEGKRSALDFHASPSSLEGSKSRREDEPAR